MPDDEGTKGAGRAIIPRARATGPGVDEMSLFRHRAVQSAILPWRRKGRKNVEILLVTSRGGGRWIIPKGWPMSRKTLRESACQEAFEEAGVRGQAEATPAGTFVADKTDMFGRTRQIDVLVYPMEVEEELADWPEKLERQRRWHSPAEVGRAVQSPSLRELIDRFVQSDRTAG